MGCILAEMLFHWLVLPINGHWNHLWACDHSPCSNGESRNREKGAVCNNGWSRTEVRLISLELHDCPSYLQQDVLLGSGPSWSVPRRRYRARTGGTKPGQYFPFQRDWWGGSGERFPSGFGQLGIQHPILRCCFQLCGRQEVSPMFCLGLRASVYCRSLHNSILSSLGC